MALLTYVGSAVTAVSPEVVELVEGPEKLLPVFEVVAVPRGAVVVRDEAA